MEIPLASEKLFSLGPLPITNTMFTSWIVAALLIGFAYVSTKKIALVPTGLQNVAEFMVESFQNLVASIAPEKADAFFPIVGSFFFFIIFGNYIGLLPGFGTIGFWHMEAGQRVFIPLLRSMNSDLNNTVALALVSVITTHYFAIKYLGLFHYIKKFFSFHPIYLFVGVLELFGEITKIFSLSFRLFGNIFAGEVLLTTASTKLFAFLIPIPFYFLEILVGFVQALIFAMLTLVFMVILTSKEH